MELGTTDPLSHVITTNLITRYFHIMQTKGNEKIFLHGFTQGQNARHIRTISEHKPRIYQKPPTPVHKNILASGVLVEDIARAFQRDGVYHNSAYKMIVGRLKQNAWALSNQKDLSKILDISLILKLYIKMLFHVMVLNLMFPKRLKS